METHTTPNLESSFNFPNFSAFLRKLNAGSNFTTALEELVNGLFNKFAASRAMLITQDQDRKIRVIDYYNLESDEINQIEEMKVDRQHPISLMENGKKPLCLAGSSVSIPGFCDMTGTMLLPICHQHDVEFVLVIGFTNYPQLYLNEFEFLDIVIGSIAIWIRGINFRDHSNEINMNLERNQINLNNRQIKIAEMIMQGATNTRISKNLGFSEATIRYETIKLYERLRVKNRAQAAAKIREIFG